jgi:hypothetical protein
MREEDGVAGMSERDRSIDEAIASLIKGMLIRGDDQSDIAAFFLVNGGRIAEINNGKRFAEVKSAKHDDLPPPFEHSPYELWQKGKWP